MSKLLVEFLKGAGIDTSALDENALGGLEEQLSKAAQANAEAELKEVQAKLAEAEKRRSGQDATISQYDIRQKELEAQLAAAKQTPVVAPQPAQAVDYSAALKSELDPLRQLVTDLAGKYDATAAALASEQAKTLRRETIDRLAKDNPALADPRFAALLPDTTEEAVLREVGETLTKFAEATEVSAYKRIRDGHVPASSPPRVSPGNQEEFQAELARIRNLQATGQLTPQEAIIKTREAAKSMKPKE